MTGRKNAASSKQSQQGRSGANSNHPSALRQSESPGRVADDRTAREAVDSEFYEIGFGKPPSRTQFKKGRSGNPKGRPKQSPNFRTMVKGVLTSPIPVRQGDKQRNVTKLEAIILQTSIKALKGDNAAAQTLLKLAAQADLLNSAEEVAESPELTAAEQAIFDEVKPWIRSRFANSE